MALEVNRKQLMIEVSILIFLFIALLSFLTYQVISTNKAHTTFEGYCKWRGLGVESKSDTFGYCKDTKTGEIYKMVLFENKWYLDGDLPCGFLCL